MAHNVKQVTIAKIHFSTDVRSFLSLSMLLTVLLFLNCQKRAETHIFVVAVVYFADFAAV